VLLQLAQAFSLENTTFQEHIFNYASPQCPITARSRCALVASHQISGCFKLRCIPVRSYDNSVCAAQGQHRDQVFSETDLENVMKVIVHRFQANNYQ